MKFKQFLSEHRIPEYVFNDFLDKLKDKRIQVGDIANVPMTLVLNDAGVISTNGKLHGKKIVFKCKGMGLPSWGRYASSDQWDPALDIDFIALTIEDFRYIPDVKRLTFNAYNIKSLNDIDRLTNVESISFDGAQVPLGPTGLLKLLKMKNLSKVKFRNSGFFDSDQKERTVEKIINEHLSSKDLPECMDALIEAGLKEFAKL